MRFISLLVAFCFSLNVMASTGTVQELEKVMDDYQYSMSVEWDQKDEAFYNSKTKELFSNLEKLIKENGLNKETLMSVINKKLNNPALVEALTLKASLLPKNVSADELVGLVKDSANDMYARGASWNGQVVFTYGIIILIVGIIAYNTYWSATHECVAWEPQWQCNTYSNCSGGYYDPYYGGYYGSSYCYGSYTTCGWYDVCTQYVEKK